MWDRRAKIVRVIDGDTVEALLDQGFGDTKRITLRLKGARAPERGQQGSMETMQFVERWLVQRMRTLAWPFVVVTYRTSADVEDRSFARYIADVLTADLGETLSEAINQFVHDNGYPVGRTVKDQ